MDIIRIYERNCKAFHANFEKENPCSYIIMTNTVKLNIIGWKGVKLEGNCILKTEIILITLILLNKQRRQTYQYFKYVKCTKQLPLCGLGNVTEDITKLRKFVQK